MSTPEGAVKGAIKGYLRSLPCCWFHMTMTYGYGTSGAPDIIGCYKGVFFAIEVKAPGKLSRLTPLQKQAIAHINAAQGWAIAADSLQHVIELIRLIDVSLKVPA